MTFYGESVAIDSATNLSGSAVASVVDVQVRAGSATFTAGDSTRFASDLSYHYLEPGDAAVVSWVVEVLSGSGTLTFAEGIGDTATSLGSRTITGPAQVVVGSSAITAANVIADTDARLLVTCTAGTLVVQQVKLRVWPPDGVGGGWSDPYPEWTDEDPVAGARTERAVSADTSGSGSAAVEWDAVIALAQTHLDEPVAGGGVFVTAPLGGGHAIETVAIHASEGGGLSAGAFIMGLTAIAVGAGVGEGAQIDSSLGLVDGVDYITPPDEVNFDILELVQGLGDRAWEWTNAGVYVSGDPGTPSTAMLAVADGPADLDFASWPDSSAFALSSGQNAITMPVGEIAVFAESHEWLFDAPDFPGGTSASAVPAAYSWALGVGDPSTEDFAPLSVRVTYPPYRVWSPEVAPPTTRSVVRHGTRNDGFMSRGPRRWGQESSYLSGRVGGMP